MSDLVTDPSTNRSARRDSSDGCTLELIEPTPDLQASYIGLIRELVERGEPLIPFPLQFPYDDFSGLLEDLAAYAVGERLPLGFVPHSTYWLVRDGEEVVGVSNLRHELNERLRREGGHIGYGIRPSARGQGFGTEILRLTLRRAEELGLHRVLLVCDRDNEASARTILANGGVLESEESLSDGGGTMQRYWIDLDPNMQRADGP